MNKNKCLGVLRGAIGILGILAAGHVAAEGHETSYGDVFSALVGGKPRLLLNYRFEHVDDDNSATKDAYASTLRSVLGYETGRFYGFAINAEMEGILVLGPERFNDGGANGRTQFATVVDPEGLELNQAYLSFGKLKDVPIIQDTEFRAGRQLITYRKAPFHRFVGPVVWRQNWQTFDGYTLSNKSLPDTHIRMGYIYNINRIFGEDNPTFGLHDRRLDGYLFNAQNSSFSLGHLQAYAFLLDFNNPNTTAATAFFQSTETYGGRFNGKYKIAPKTKLLYAAELAQQSDYAENPTDIDSHYLLGELGLSYDVGGDPWFSYVEGEL